MLRLSNLYATLIVSFTDFPPALTCNLQGPLLIPRILSIMMAQFLCESGVRKNEIPDAPVKEDPDSSSADATVMELFTPTVGVPVTMTFTLVVLVFGFFTLLVAFGVTATLKPQVPGFTAVILVPLTVQTALELFTTVIEILAPRGIATFATLFTEAKEIFLPVFVLAVLLTAPIFEVHETLFTTTQKLCDASAPLPRIR